MVPCGIPGVEMTSIARELGANAALMGDTIEHAVGAVEAVFGLTAQSAVLSDLDATFASSQVR